MRYSKEKIKELLNIDIEDDYAYVEVVSEKKHKTNQQTKLFHSLLMCFWKSGCSSFNSYEQMRNYYKEKAQLLEYQYKNDLKQETKEMLWKAIRLLPLDKEELNRVIELIRGKVIVWHSWSECSKQMATVALDAIIQDMFNAGVDSSSQAGKFREIMEGLNSWYEGY